MSSKRSTTDILPVDDIIRRRLDDVIILNYGIEIECVFDIINELSVYISFINIFLSEDKERNSRNLTMYKDSFNLMLSKLIAFIRECGIESIQVLYENDIYKSLNAIYENDKNFYEFFKKNYDDISKYISSTISERTRTRANAKLKQEYEKILLFIRNFTDFIKNIIDLIVKYINVSPTFNPDLKKPIDTIIELVVIGGDFFNDFNNRFKLNLNENLKIFNENDMETMEEFYDISRHNRDRLYLYLTQDCSVICTYSDLYKNIITSKLEKYNFEKYKFLLNECEFITQVFKTPDDIETKLDIFFKNTTVERTILNCEKTSNHFHISFNKRIDGIIKPNIKIIIALLCICHYFQDKIYSLFLKTRNNNFFCAKLNYKSHDISIECKDEYTTDEYDNCIKKLFDIFYISSDDNKIKLNKYYWLNIVNLYNIKNNRPPTVEFRIKHGSTDTKEMANVCILYKNIIDYAIELSLTITNGSNNIKQIYDSICQYIIGNGGFDAIYNSKILGSVKDYFTNPQSPYVIGLQKLNESIFSSTEIQEVVEGGAGATIRQKIKIPSQLTYPLKKKSPIKKSQKYDTGNAFLDDKLTFLDDKMIYKINSFGTQFIGYGLSDDIINGLSLYLNINNSNPIFSDEEKFNKFLKNHALSFQE